MTQSTGTATHPQKSPVRELLDNGSWLYAVLVFVGFLDLHSYYSAFGISIWAYLSVGELLLSFLTLTGPLLFLISFLLLVVFITMRGTDKSDTIDKVLEGIKSSYSNVKNLWWQKFIRGSTMVAFGLIAWGVPVFLITTWIYLAVGETLVRALVLLIIALALLLVLFVLVAQHIGKGRSTRLKFTGSAFVVVLVLLMCLLNRFRAENRIQYGGNDKVFIETKEHAFTTSDTLCYIGQCNAAVFLWDLKAECAVIVPTSEIILMSKTRMP